MLRTKLQCFHPCGKGIWRNNEKIMSTTVACVHPNAVFKSQIWTCFHATPLIICLSAWYETGKSLDTLSMDSPLATRRFISKTCASVSFVLLLAAPIARRFRTEASLAFCQRSPAYKCSGFTHFLLSHLCKTISGKYPLASKKLNLCADQSLRSK